MKALHIFFILIMPQFTLAQVHKYIVVNNIEFRYDQVGVATANIFLKEEKDSSLKTDISNIKLSRLQGEVAWNNGNSSRIDVPLIQDDENKFRFFAQLKVGSGDNSVLLTDGNHTWNAINNLRITYTVSEGDKTRPGEAFNSRIVPSDIIAKGEKPKLNVLGNLRYFEDDKGELKLAIQPIKLFKLMSFKLIRNGTLMYDYANKQDLISKNGELVIPINLEEGITFTDRGSYSVSATIELQEDDHGFVNISNKDINVLRQPKLKILNFVVNDKAIPENKFGIVVHNEDNLSFQVHTTGTGSLKAIIFPQGFCSINCKLTSGQDYNVDLNGLQKVDKVQTAYIQFSDGETPFSTPYKCEKNASITVSNFSIGMKGNNAVLVKFDLPDWVNGQVRASLDKNNVSIVLNKTQGKSHYENLFSGSDFTRIKDKVKDTVLEDKVIITVDGQSVFDLTLSFFDASLVNKKIDALISESTKKHPDKKAIDPTMSELVAFIGKAGAAIDNNDVQNAVKTLAVDKKSQEETASAMKTIKTVSTWVSTLAPIVIPLLL